MAATAGDMGRTAKIMLNVFNGARQPIDPGVQLLVRITDGNQEVIFNDYRTGPSISFEVPFNDNLADRYTVLVSADGYFQAGFYPVNVSPSAWRIVDIMLLPREGHFNFAESTWVKVKQNYPQVASILGASSDATTDAAAENHYDQLLENSNKQPMLACLWNLITAMSQIHLPQGTPVDYLKELIWEDLLDKHLFSPTQDRFYAYCDQKLVDQVRLACQQGAFSPEPNPNLFHAGATSSYKQIQFGEANVQLTFHEGETKNIAGVDCVAVEPDIDYYKDLGAHALLEVIANAVTHGLTDPKVIYVLRWIAGRRANVPDFNPPYTFI